MGFSEKQALSPVSLPVPWGVICWLGQAELLPVGELLFPGSWRNWQYRLLKSNFHSALGASLCWLWKKTIRSLAFGKARLEFQSFFYHLLVCASHWVSLGPIWQHCQLALPPRWFCKSNLSREVKTHLKTVTSLTGPGSCMKTTAPGSCRYLPNSSSDMP